MELMLMFKSRSAYRKWLEKNCLTSKPIWIKFYKDGTESISYSEALDESLCFGWIDSQIRQIDERVYVRKFFKRRPHSRWFNVNRKKIRKRIIASVAVILLIYLSGYLFWRKQHVMTFSDYPGTTGQLSPSIEQTDNIKIMLSKFSDQEKKLFFSCYEFSAEKNAYLNQKPAMEINDQLKEVLDKYGYKDNTPVVIYISVSDENDYIVLAYEPLIRLDSRINELSIVSE